MFISIRTRPTARVFCDDFESGSRAAAAGGTTTIIPFAYQNKGQPLRDAVNRYHARAEGKSPTMHST